MVGRFVSRLSAIVAFVAVSVSASAQNGSITGKVTNANTGRAIAGANIAAVSGARAAATVVSGQDGSFRLTNLPVGTYSVVATKLGFTVTRAEAVTVSAGASATADFAMNEFTVQLNPIVTTGTRGTPEKILDSPSSISVVSAERMSSRPATTIK